MWKSSWRPAVPVGVLERRGGNRHEDTPGSAGKNAEPLMTENSRVARRGTERADGSIMLNANAEVIDTIKRKGGAKSIRLKRTPEMSYRPGQYMFVSLVTDTGESAVRPLSFSSSPGCTEYVEVTKKLTGSDFSRALDSVVPGDHVNVKMPRGEFIYEGDPPRIALLAGGIGVTPFKSIC
ncbi:MAG: hypothetical protein GF392_00160, partial [Candidatus Omnitrophica bacterium]|nr:hypothetical protein [Candidatus Omnitrophota bacterium]